MKVTCVTLNGVVINVGPWNVAASGALPVGATTGDWDVSTTVRGKLVLTSNYKELRAAEYPAIGDQLDALYHAGLFPADMAALIAAVKAKYPKPV